jgi:hypothetical protein
MGCTGQRQPIEQARRDQERGETEQHPGGGQTGNGHRADDVRDESTEIATSASQLLYD